MHLLALGASWHIDTTKERYVQIRLNAPFGAQCFLTQPPKFSLGSATCLNAPFGARFFLALGLLFHDVPRFFILMHLLALGAF